MVSLCECVGQQCRCYHVPGQHVALPQRVVPTSLVEGKYISIMCGAVAKPVHWDQIVIIEWCLPTHGEGDCQTMTHTHASTSVLDTRCSMHLPVFFQ